MEVRNCKVCGRIFNYLGGAPLCAICIKELDSKFEQVKEYIYEHPGSNIQVVAEENDVSVQQLKKWVREERLEFAEGSLVGLACESCGAMIKTGRFCSNCKDKLANRLGNVYKEVPHEQKKVTKENPKMRFLDN